MALSLTLGETKTAVKRYLQEPSGGRWGGTALDDTVNQIIAEIAARTRCLTKKTTSSIVADQANYSFPTDCPSADMIRAVHYNSKFIRRVAKHHVYDAEEDGEEFSAAYPRWFIRAAEIYITPTPASAITNGLEIFHAYIPAELSSDATANPLPADLHRTTVLLVAAEASLADRNYPLHTRLQAKGDRALSQYMSKNAPFGEPKAGAVVDIESAGRVTIQKGYVLRTSTWED